MPARQTTNNKVAPNGDLAIIFVHASGVAAPDADWLAHIASLKVPLYSHADLPGAQRTLSSFDEKTALIKELANDAQGRAIIFLRAGLWLEEAQLTALIRQLASHPEKPALTVLSNSSAEYNPLAGCLFKETPEPELVVRAVAVMSRPVTHDWKGWPEHLLALSSSVIAELTKATDSAPLCESMLAEHLGVSERIFVPDLRVGLATGLPKDLDKSPAPPPWGDLCASLQAWLDAGAPSINPPGDGGRLVTLHITHSWGGGVGLWVKSYIEADTHSDHLQLRSESLRNQSLTGQRLCLYLGNQLACPIAQWWLQPPIDSVVAENEQYAEVVEDIMRSFEIDRVIVSSLVGHSLDALRTKRPTLQVLHDYFPCWPLLSVHPEPFLTPEGTDLGAALSAHSRNWEFANTEPQFWMDIREAYLACVAEYGIRLIAPSKSVRELHARIDDRWQALDIRVIPHGLPGFRSLRPIEPRPRKDGKLRLVIPGRIQRGKGKALLRDSLPELTRWAQVYLLGTGKQGEEFFGISGVSVIVQYERDELGEVLEKLAPDAAALLSIVPETFSYMLSELRACGVPVIATRNGSFTERIHDGQDGWLIEPDSDALIGKIRALEGHHDSLQEMRSRLAERTEFSMLDMLSAYQRSWPENRAETQAGMRQQGLYEVASAAYRYQLIQTENQVRQVKGQIGELRRELARRARWGEQLDRDLAERTAWALELDSELATTRSELAAKKSELVRYRNQLHKLRNDLQSLTWELREANQLNELIVRSLSWRITRPMRVAKRILVNAWQARIYNPLRWPLLLSKSVRYVVTQGLSGALHRVSAPQGHIKAARSKATPPPPAPGTRDDKPQSSGLDRSLGDLHFIAFDQPKVSIVIPVYNNWEYTARCLISINATASKIPFEVILVDDASSDETQKRFSDIAGLQYLPQPENRGFIASCNAGARVAKGQYLVFLNNDTEVTPGWLDHLIDPFQCTPDLGLAGAKLIYPDGSLQECGGIILNDGSGWNYGRHDQADRPEYEYARDVDYCSGACIALPAALFRELDGFDTHFMPAYYEDTDLAFRVRDRGLRVMVQPQCVVTHHEGVSSGTELTAGIKKFQEVNREKFQQRWKSRLSHHPEPIPGKDAAADIRRARDHGLRGRVLMIDATTPEPDKDSGSVRMVNLMRCFIELGYGVTFLADNRQHAGRYTEALQQLGVEALYLPWLDSLQGLLSERGAEFDFVFISRHYIAVNYLSLVRKYCNQAALIFDTVDLHYLREERLAELEQSPTLRQVARQTRRSELGMIASADMTLVVSPAEAEILETHAPGSAVHVVSNIHEIHGCRQSFADREDIFFVGGYQHPPNVDAVLWFVHEVWPLVRAQLPDLKFHLVGSKAPNELSSLEVDGVEFHGFVPELEPFLDGCRLAVAPLRYGAGVKGKVNMSMSYGQPVVATTIAVEGMHATTEEDVLIADTAEAFAKAVVRLYGDHELWLRLSEGGLKNVERYFSLDTARRSLADMLKRVAPNDAG